MRCDICNAIIPKPVFNDKTGTFDPCLSCLGEIEDAVKPEIEEEWYDGFYADDLEDLDDWDL